MHYVTSEFEQVFILLVLGEMAGICGSLHFRNQRCCDLFLVDGDPVSGLEPAVVFNVVDAVPQVAETFRQVDLEQVAEQIFQIGAEVRRKPHLLVPITKPSVRTAWKKKIGNKQ